MASDFYKKLGKKVSYLRKNMGLTRETFSEKAGLSAYYLGEIERGVKKPSLDKLMQICKVLNIQIHELLNLEK